MRFYDSTRFREKYNINDDDIVIINIKPEGYVRMRDVTSEQLEKINNDFSTMLGNLFEDAANGRTTYYQKDSIGRYRKLECNAYMPSGFEFNGESFRFELDEGILSVCHEEDNQSVCDIDMTDYLEEWFDLRPMFFFPGIASEILDGIHTWAQSPAAENIII